LLALCNTASLAGIVLVRGWATPGWQRCAWDG